MKQKLYKSISVFLICLTLVFSIVPKKAEANPLILALGAGELVQVAAAALGAATGIAVYLTKDDIYQLCQDISAHATEHQKDILMDIGQSNSSVNVTTKDVSSLIALAQAKMTTSPTYKINFTELEEANNYGANMSVMEACREYSIPLAAFVEAVHQTLQYKYTKNGANVGSLIFVAYPGGYVLSGGGLSPAYVSKSRDPVTHVPIDFKLRITSSGCLAIHVGQLVTISDGQKWFVPDAPIIDRFKTHSDTILGDPETYNLQAAAELTGQKYACDQVYMPLNETTAPTSLSYPNELSLRTTDMPLDASWSSVAQPYAIPRGNVMELNPYMTYQKEMTIDNASTGAAEPSKPSISLDLSWLKDLLGKIIDFLKSILDAVLSIPRHIGEVINYLSDLVRDVGNLAGKIAAAVAGALSGAFDSVKDAVLSIPGALTGLFDSVIAHVKAIPGALTGFFSSLGDLLRAILDEIKKFFDVSEFQLDFSKLRLAELKTIFPFCIPFDIYSVLKSFNSTSSFTPGINLDTQYFSIHQQIDLSPIMPILGFVRAMEAVFFTIMLYMVTKRLIKW